MESAEAEAGLFQDMTLYINIFAISKRLKLLQSACKQIAALLKQISKICGFCFHSPIQIALTLSLSIEDKIHDIMIPVVKIFSLVTSSWVV